MPTETPYVLKERNRLGAYDGESAPGVFPASRMQRVLGRSCSQWTTDDLVGLVRDRGIRLVSLMHVGGDGALKTLDFVPRSEAHLRDIIAGGERADGSSLFKGLGIETGRSDIVLRPRIESAFLDPFSPLPTLALMCGHYGRDGEPLPQSPDTIVWRAFERIKRETGVELWAHGEIEYFVGRRLNESDAFCENDGGYHASSPSVFGEPLRRRALALLSEIGLPLKYGHSEVGYIAPEAVGAIAWEQHEIELALAPLPLAAEAVALTHWVLRNLASAMGLHANFDPIVQAGHAGNGLHFHLSPVLDGRHAGARGSDGDFEAPAKWLIAGLTQLGGALMAFGNRSEESFVRLTQGKEAPTGVFWGESDRRALIRLPITVRAEDGRHITIPTIEFRLGDGSAHSHFLLAGIAQALMHGHTLEDLDKLLAETAAKTSGAKGTEAAARVPRSPSEVAVALERRRPALEAGEIFPSGFIDQLIKKLRGQGRPAAA